jgi:hypothetical protein
VAFEKKYERVLEVMTLISVLMKTQMTAEILVEMTTLRTFLFS